jgi:3-keto-disaccharide hydrolase
MPEYDRAIRLCLVLIPIAAAALFGRLASAEPPDESILPRGQHARFALQGEYTADLDGGKAKLGIQVVALGARRYRGVFFTGGLPGDGWAGAPREAVDAKADEPLSTVSFKRGPRTVTIRDGSASVTAPDGKTLGTGAKVERKSPTLGAKPPQGATILFDGSSLNDFDGAIAADRSLKAGTTSKQKFGSGHLHLEFREPFNPKEHDQKRGNSGCYLAGRYEVQILDTFGLEAGKTGCGAIYDVKAPDTNACYPPLSWQTYDIDYVAPEYQGDRKVRNARLTVKQNGVSVQNDVEVASATDGAPIAESPEPGPLFLQPSEGDVTFRNIWVTTSEPQPAPVVAKAPDHVEKSPGDRIPDVGNFANFLAQQERAAEAARKRLLQTIDNRTKALERSDLSPDQKRLQLEKIQADREAFVSTDKLPSCDELLGAVVDFVEDYQKIIQNSESMRQHWADRAVRTDDSAALDKIKTLETTLNNITGGRGQFTKNSKWSGHRQQEREAFEMHLTVNELAGSAFRGELTQKGEFGHPAIMKVEGELDRNRIAFHTTEMVRGKNRSLGFQGYLLSDRIICGVEGVDKKAASASGWMSLWRDKR